MNEGVIGYDPLIFKQYQSLAVAVLKQYQKDKERELKRLKVAKENLVKRLQTGKSQGIVNRWNMDSAWKSWESSLQSFDSFCYFEKTEIYRFYEDIVSCKLNHGGAELRLNKRSY